MKNIFLSIPLLIIGLGITSCKNIIVRDIGSIMKNSDAVDCYPSISPDYLDVTIPFNISPLNFVVKENGAAFCVHVFSSRGEAITIQTKRPQIRIPLKQWRTLLSENRGNKLHFDVYVKSQDKKWTKYKTIENYIAAERIDSYLFFRTLSVLYNYSRDLRIYQKNLENNDETEVLNAMNFFPGCCNCHTLLNNDPNKMFIHVRTQDYGGSALIAVDGKIQKINAKFQYTSWHPSGKFAAYSSNKVDQCFHSVWKDPRDVFDHSSDIFVYNIKKQHIDTVPQLSQGHILETWPNWSPDGRYLYFCSGPILWDDMKANPPPNLEKLQYSLMRIAYNVGSDTWGGDIDTVLPAEETGLSISQPRISPDGRFILFCMHQYGNSPYSQMSSDLYLLDIQSNKYAALDINSEFSESWHTWAINSRWIAFTSKREGGILARIYISYLDNNGKAHKAFILPQKDPAFYDSFIKVHNVPEFASAAFPISQKDLVRLIRSPDRIDVNIPVTGATPRSRQGELPWRSARPK